MELTTVYTAELIEEVLRCKMKPLRKKASLWLVFTSVLGVALMLLHLPEKGRYTAYAAVLFLTCALIWVCALARNRGSMLRRQALQAVNAEPNKTAAYRLAEEAMYVTIHSDVSEAEARLLYSIFQSVQRVNETVCLLTTKSNLMYILSCENGIDAVYAFLTEKVRNET